MALHTALGTAAADARRRAAPGDIDVELSVVAACGLHIPNEPVLFVVGYQNLTDAALYLYCRPDEPVRLQVQDESGHPLATSAAPPRRLGPDEYYMAFALPARGRAVPFIRPGGELITFTEPGDYTVTATQYDWAKTPREGQAGPPPPVLAEASVTYTVRSARLGEEELMVQWLTWYAVWGASLKKFVDRPFWPEPWRDPDLRSALREHAGEMLADVKLEAALPYLTQIASIECKPWAFEGIRKIGTPAAKEALRLLASSRRLWVAVPAGTELGKMAQDDGRTTAQE